MSRLEWEELDNLYGDIEAVELLTDLIDDLVSEEANSDQPMHPKVHGQITILFNAVRDRVAAAKRRHESLTDEQRARMVCSAEVH